MTRSMQRKCLWPLVLVFGHATAQEVAAPAFVAGIDAIFADLDKPDSPGCALGVIEDGRLSYARGYGMANLEHAVANDSTIVFDIGSTSKQFTATAILLLAQDGKLSLDDDVRRYVPELPQYQRPITIRHLLHHTSGLRDYVSLFWLAGVSFERTTTEQDALDYIVRQKALNFAPGDEFVYSNSGYVLLSIIVQRVSGKSFPAFAQERIFEPLGMTNTIVLNDHNRIVPRRAWGYSRRSSGGFMIDMSNFEQTGDGGVLSTIEDLAKWDRNFYDPKVGGEAWLRSMHETGKLNNGQDLIYAAGLEIDRYKGLRRVKHGGVWAGYRAELLRFPDQRLSVVCLCNAGVASTPSTFAMKVATLYLEKELAAFDAQAPRTAARTPSPRRVSDAEAKAWAGTYRDSVGGGLRRITVTDGKLRLDSFSTQSRELTALAKNRFAGQEGLFVEFMTHEAGVSLHITRMNESPRIYEKVAAYEPASSELAAFAGRYFSEELDAAYELGVRDGQLFVTFPDRVEDLLVPTFKDSFSTPDGAQLEFHRDAVNNVPGFAIQSGRIRGVEFTRRGGS